MKRRSGLAQKNIIPAPLVIETTWLGLADLILGMTPLLLKKSSSLILQCVIAVASEVTLPRLSAIFPKHSCEEGGLKIKKIIILSRDLPKVEVIGLQFYLKNILKIDYYSSFETRKNNNLFLAFLQPISSTFKRNANQFFVCCGLIWT